MSHGHDGPQSPLQKGFRTLQEYSAFLLVGTAAALIWNNIDHHSYHEFAHDINLHLGHHEYNSFHFFVNDVFMVFFFGIAMKEVTQSFLPGGELSSLQKASMPAIATMGGVFGPIGLFFLLHMLVAPDPPITQAWAVPTATDIAYSWLFAGLIFGRAHPAVTFLLVLAVLDDLIGMMIIAIFYTSEVHPEWLGLVVLAMAGCELMRRKGITNFWPYLIWGAPLAWMGLFMTGVHAALALVPVIPFMPHAERDAGLYVKVEVDHNSDTLAHFEHFFKPIVDVGLFFFGLANAGVLLNVDSLAGGPTWIIFLSLLIGKTVGITIFAIIGQMLGLKLPKNMDMKSVIVLGCVAGVGFTVALFVTGVALKSGTPELIAQFKATGTEDMIKLGALLSFAAGGIAMVLGKMFGIKKIHHAGSGEGDGHGSNDASAEAPAAT